MKYLDTVWYSVLGLRFGKGNDVMVVILQEAN